MTSDAYIFVHFNNDFSGSPRVLRDVFDSHGLRDFEKILLTNDREGFLSNLPGTVVVPYEYYNSVIMRILSFGYYQLALFWTVFYQVIRLRLTKKSPILLLNTMFPFCAALAGKALGAKVIYYVHETDVRPKFVKFIFRAVIERVSDKVIFVSRFLFDKEKFNRPNQSVINPGTADLGLQSESQLVEKFVSRRVLFVGSLRYFKGADTFLKLAEQLPDLKFNMALNASDAELLSYKNTHFVPENVVFFSRPDNLVEMYQGSILCLNLTNPRLVSETFGMTLIEAMSGYTPVIAPPAGGPMEIIDDSSGLLIDPDDLLKLTYEISKMCADYEYWRSYALGAKERSNNFNMVRFNDLINSELRSFCG